MNAYDIDAKLALCAVAGVKVEPDRSPQRLPQIRLLLYRGYYVRVWLHWSIERWAECTARLIEDARAKKSQAAAPRTTL